jgi:hypothetical protein
MKPKPTKTAPPRTLPDGQIDQSNVDMSERGNEWVLAAIARGLPAFARGR